jgi:putative ABC transport system ATP-binding protein
VIELRGISRTFDVGGRPVHALRDLNLRIAAGEYVAVTGPSGSGKSTLLHLLGCLDRPTTGTYRFEGRDVARLDEGGLSDIRRHKIGFVFQSFHLVPRLTAAENVELPMVFAGVERRERAARVARALAAVGLSERAAHRPSELSGGESQRVAIARAVVLDPKLVLADEPTGNLDSASGHEVLELLTGMNARGLTLVIVTHNPEVAAQAGRRIRLADGRLVEDARREARSPAPGAP